MLWLAILLIRTSTSKVSHKVCWLCLESQLEKTSKRLCTLSEEVMILLCSNANMSIHLRQQNFLHATLRAQLFFMLTNFKVFQGVLILQANFWNDFYVFVDLIVNSEGCVNYLVLAAEFAILFSAIKSKLLQFTLHKPVNRPKIKRRTTTRSLLDHLVLFSVLPEIETRLTKSLLTILTLLGVSEDHLTKGANEFTCHLPFLKL